MNAQRFFPANPQRAIILWFSVSYGNAKSGGEKAIPFACLPVPALLLDDAGRVVDANGPAEELFGGAATPTASSLRR